MEIDWQNIKRVLVVRLRSIGDTVLTTPSLVALRRFLPDAQIDVLLEDWVAPVLEGFDAVDNVLTVGSGSLARLKTGARLARTGYDVAFNLHGGTTGTFFTTASRARHRVGLKSYQYAFLYNHVFPSPAEFWGSRRIHSAEQQLALLGFAGVPVRDRPKTRLTVTADALDTVVGLDIPHGGRFALLHPAAAYHTKQWSIGGFAKTAEWLHEKGLASVAVASSSERPLLDELVDRAGVKVTVYDHLSLSELTALSAKAAIFVGNDSGIAHIAGAVGTPSVVIFGSSNRTHWHPWTDAPNEIVFREFDCQPCPGHVCGTFGTPRCILEIREEDVFHAIERILTTAAEREKAGVEVQPASHRP